MSTTSGAGDGRQIAAEVPYAGVGRRLGAVGVDWLVVGSVFAAGNMLVPPRLYAEMFFVHFVILWMYCALLESSAHEGTLGKMALGLRVRDLSFRRISFWRATGRFFGRFVWTVLPMWVLIAAVVLISILVQKANGGGPVTHGDDAAGSSALVVIVLGLTLLYFGVIALIYGLTIRKSKRKQSPHDMMARCVVVKAWKVVPIVIEPKRAN